MLRRSLLTAAGAAILATPAIRSVRADTLDDVKKRGTLIIGTEAAYVPYEFFKDGKIIGYDPDIANLMVPKIGAKAEFVDTQWSGIIPALYARKFDCIISAMTITKERAEKEGVVLHALCRCQQRRPAARRGVEYQDRRGPVREDPRRATGQCSRRDH